jgi:hypothetical protein
MVTGSMLCPTGFSRTNNILGGRRLRRCIALFDSVFLPLIQRQKTALAY